MESIWHTQLCSNLLSVSALLAPLCLFQCTQEPLEIAYYAITVQDFHYTWIVDCRLLLAKSITGNIIQHCNPAMFFNTKIILWPIFWRVPLLCHENVWCYWRISVNVHVHVLGVEKHGRIESINIENYRVAPKQYPCHNLNIRPGELGPGVFEKPGQWTVDDCITVHPPPVGARVNNYLPHFRLPTTPRNADSDTRFKSLQLRVLLHSASGIRTMQCMLIMPSQLVK
jgi:hypothetical protein